MFNFVTRLMALKDSIKLVAAGFSDTISDVENTFGDVENAIVNKSWTVDTLNGIVVDAEKLYPDFVKNYTGSKDQIKSVLTQIAGLFN